MGINVDCHEVSAKQIVSMRGSLPPQQTIYTEPTNTMHVPPPLRSQPKFYPYLLYFLYLFSFFSGPSPFHPAPL
jgi:hypothetical protein